MKKFAGKSDEAVKKSTGRSWDEWFKILDKADASKMPHKEIVLLLHEKGLVKKGIGWPVNRSFSVGWWAQSIVVGYEEKIGRRVFGKREEGDFSVSIGKTLSGSTDDILKAWQNLVKGKKEFNTVKVVGDSRISQTNNGWRYWKADMADGSKLSVNIGPSTRLRTSGPKNDKQSRLSITLDKLKDKKAVEESRKYWKEFLKKL